MLLHAHTTVFVWMGLCAHPPHHRVAMHTTHTHMGWHGVVQQHPLIITTHLHAWQHACGAAQSTGAAPPRQRACHANTVCGEAMVHHLTHKCSSAHLVANNPTPCGLDKAALESCHDDAVFEQVFGMVRDAFGRLAMWHTPNHNHKHRLCHHTPPPWHNTTPPHTTSCNPLLWHVRHVGHCHDAHHHTLPTTKWCCCCGGHG